MDFSTTSLDKTLWILTFPAILETQTLAKTTFLMIMAFSLISLLTWAFSRGGSGGGGLAWKNGRSQLGRVTIPGPSGLPFFGSLFSLSHGLAHRTLALKAEILNAKQLMAFSLGSTPAVVTSEPHIAREILASPSFSNRPIKQSAKLLMFSRAIGFAPNGSYWRLLRRISSAHLFSPKRIMAHENGRQLNCAHMLQTITKEWSQSGLVVLRKHLQNAALNNIMGTVFGKHYDLTNENEESRELKELVREGFELLGAFNWSDYLPWLSYFYDPFYVQERCSALVPRVKKLVKRIIDEHRIRKFKTNVDNNASQSSDFVDVLLSLEGDEKLEEDDMVAVLWEMIFRGTDTTALLTEWVMAELVLNPNVQEKLYQELNLMVGPGNPVTDAAVAKSTYLQAVVKETLRLHPPGPLLSWARLSTSDVQLSNGMVVPANTTALVNMWAITHDPQVWEDPHVFKPERFAGDDVDVRGSDTRLAPFGSGRRVCPGKTLGLVTVGLWVAKLVHHFKWVKHVDHPVDLSEVLKLSCEMENPLHAGAVPRCGFDKLL